MVRLGMAALASLAALAALTALPAPVSAGPLDDARKAVEASDYLAARGQLTAALEAGGASPGDLAEIYKLTGIVEGALGESDAASAAFAKWLALEPKGDLPAGTSPKIMRPFEAASAKAHKRELLKVKTETSASPPSVTLVLAYDPLDLIKTARAYVHVEGYAAEQAIDGAPSKPIALPSGDRLDIRLVGLDEHGNHVVELGTTDVPIVVLGKSGGGGRRHNSLPRDIAVRDGDRSHPRPLYLKWWAWGGGAVVIGGLAAGFGFAARSNANELEQLNASSQDHPFSEAQDVESAARRDATIFNVGMGLAGALAIGAAILYVTEDKHAHTTVGAVPTSGGGVFVVGGQF